MAGDGERAASPAEPPASPGVGAAATALSPAVLDALPFEVAVLDQDGTIVAINAAWQRGAVTGARRGALGPGRPYADLPLVAEDRTGGLALAVHGVTKLLAGGDADFTLDVPVGWETDPQWMRVVARRIDAVDGGGAVVTHVDTTLRVRSEAAARAGEAKLASVFDVAPIGLAILSPERQILQMNRALADILQLSEEEIVRGRRRRWFNPDGSEIAERELASVRAMAEGRVVTYERLGLAQADGGTRWVAVSAAPLPGGGAVVATVDRTAEVRAEEALRASEISLREAQRIAGLGSWTLAWPSRALTVSPGLAAIFGYPADGFPEVYADAEKLLVPSAWRALDAAVERALVEGGAYELELEMVRRDGSHGWIACRGEAWRGRDGVIAGLVGTALDVSARHEVERRLRDGEERFRAAFEDAAVGLVVTAPDGRFLELNRTFCAMVGRRAEELVGGSFVDVTHPHDFEITRAAVLRMLCGESDVEHFEKRYVRPDGGVVWTRVSSRLVRDAAGEPLHIASLVQDLTARRAAEEAVRRLNEDLEARVRQRTAEVETLSYSVAHDLRGPLRAIGGFVALLQSEHGARLDEEGNRLLAVVAANSRRMTQLIEDLLTFARLGRQEVVRSAVDMEGLAREVWQELVTADPAPPAELVASPLPAVPGDPSLLRQVWVNLLSNALKFSSKRPSRRVEVSATATAGGVTFEVRDNGVGFASDEAGRLFAAFERLHPRAEFDGTGVGLALVERIVSRHGGRVWADAVPSAGASFYFFLPLAATSPTD